MGCLFSLLTRGYCTKVDDAKAVSKKIDKEILLELKNEPDEIEILLLGAPETGKSTILKQIRIIHKSDYTLEERLMFKPIVFANALQGMSIILHAVERLGKLGLFGALNSSSVDGFILPAVDLDNEEAEYDAYRFYQVLEQKTSRSHILVEDVKVTPDLAGIISRLWSDSGVQKAFQHANQFQLSDCAEYFLDHITRLAEPHYIPSTLDILHTRVKTCGIVEVKFLIKDMMFRLHDVGGQRSDRRKWLSLFDCVHAVAFCVSLADYDTVIPEEDDCNQMLESLKLFGVIVNSKVFIDAAMILLLNKTDLFQKKIARVPLTLTFPDYEGRPGEWESAAQFVSKRFKSQKKSAPQAYAHLLCATDTENMRMVVHAVTDMLIKNFLKDCGIY
eukprot:maker-scaffold276_size226481-snap-gene-1.24 protein:Tk04706 transcript:maker-scaffold276_size226481-snap-gene-1.24-mRNA-1 annotation:"hypothetical protein TRIADDRAFT_50797"